MKREKHGLTKHPLYRKWQDMKKRCYNPNVQRYKSYGAQGIRVCDEWKYSFTSFYNWSIENGWKEGLTIERLDIYGNYSPQNCKYITYSEQSYNNKTTVWVVYRGETKCLAEVCNNLNLSKSQYKNIWRHIKNGKEFEKVLDSYVFNKD